MGVKDFLIWLSIAIVGYYLYFAAYHTGEAQRSLRKAFWRLIDKLSTLCKYNKHNKQ